MIKLEQDSDRNSTRFSNFAVERFNLELSGAFDDMTAQVEESLGESLAELGRHQTDMF